MCEYADKIDQKLSNFEEKTELGRTLPNKLKRIENQTTIQLNFGMCIYRQSPVKSPDIKTL